eukprot:16434319-Heterocapsa_arctica.AAC.1
MLELLEDVIIRTFLVVVVIEIAKRVFGVVVLEGTQWVGSQDGGVGGKPVEASGPVSEGVPVWSRWIEEDEAFSIS